jgi:hypothetical protein
MPPVAPSPPPAELEHTLHITAADRDAASSTEPVEATLFMERPEAGGALPDATMMLSRDAAPAAPQPVEATILLSRDAAPATAGPVEATMMLSPSASVRDAGGHDSTLALGGLGGTNVMSLPELGSATQAPVDPHRGTPPTPQGHSPTQSAGQPSAQPAGRPFAAPRPPVPVPEAVPPPRRSRLGLWMAIVIILAAVAGTSVGLVLGGG